MKKVFAFDFDGTLTTRDSLIAFLRYACGTRRFLLGMLRHAHLIALMLLKLYPNGRAKERLFSYFFEGVTLDTFNHLCQRFARDKRQLLRPQAIETVAKAQAEGTRVFIVSASVDNWVAPFFPGVEVIGTQVEVIDGYLTGRFLTPNCYGPEKVRRLRSACPDLDHCHLTAFGDSRGDRELLQLADEAHYKPFRT